MRPVDSARIPVTTSTTNIAALIASNVMRTRRCCRDSTSMLQSQSDIFFGFVQWTDNRFRSLAVKRTTIRVAHRNRCRRPRTCAILGSHNANGEHCEKLAPRQLATTFLPGPCRTITVFNRTQRDACVFNFARWQPMPVSLPECPTIVHSGRKRLPDDLAFAGLGVSGMSFVNRENYITIARSTQFPRPLFRCNVIGTPRFEYSRLRGNRGNTKS